jgi:hypothetical protein
LPPLNYPPRSFAALELPPKREEREEREEKKKKEKKKKNGRGPIYRTTRKI